MSFFIREQKKTKINSQKKILATSILGGGTEEKGGEAAATARVDYFLNIGCTFHCRLWQKNAKNDLDDLIL